MTYSIYYSFLIVHQILKFMLLFKNIINCISINQSIRFKYFRNLFCNNNVIYFMKLSCICNNLCFLIKRKIIVAQRKLMLCYYCK